MIRIIDKKLFIPVLGLIIFLFSFSTTHAQVVINEFSSNSSSEWVELYNIGSANVDLTGWKLVDSAGNTENISGSITASGLFVYERNQGWLNNSGGDVVNLKNASGDNVDSVAYGHIGDSVNTPDSDKSDGRIPDGSGSWQTNLVWTKGSSNSQSSSTPTPSPSPIPAQTSSKAVYKLDKSKDNFGTELTSVQIYVDGGYIHHEDDETLEFYSGNECYSGVGCGFGTHVISLRKGGYSNWEDTRDFEAGMNLGVSPVLNKQSTSTPTPTKTATPTSVPTKTPASTPVKTSVPAPIPTGSPGEQISSGGRVLGIEFVSPTPTVTGSSGTKDKSAFLAFSLVGVGIIFIGAALLIGLKTLRNPQVQNDI